MSQSYECLDCFCKTETLGTDGRCPWCRSDAVLLCDLPEARDFQRGDLQGGLQDPDFWRLHRYEKPIPKPPVREPSITVPLCPYLEFACKRDADRFIMRIVRANKRSQKLVRAVAKQFKSKGEL